MIPIWPESSVASPASANNTRYELLEVWRSNAKAMLLGLGKSFDGHFLGTADVGGPVFWVVGDWDATHFLGGRSRQFLLATFLFEKWKLETQKISSFFLCFVFFGYGVRCFSWWRDAMCFPCYLTTSSPGCGVTCRLKPSCFKSPNW